MKKLLVVTLVMMMVLGLVGGVAVADEHECPAAPDVAGLLLEEAGVDNRWGTGRDGGNYIREVADHMGPETDFEFPEGNVVSKCDIEAYEIAVALFLRSLGAEVGAHLFEAVLESVVYEGVCNKFGSHIGDTLTFTFSNDVFVDEDEPNYVLYTGQDFWFPDDGKSYIDVDGNKLTITIGPEAIYGSPRLMTDQSITGFDGVLDSIDNPVVVPEDGVPIVVNSIYPTTEYSGKFNSTRDVPGEWSYNVTVARDCENGDIVWAEITLIDPNEVAIETTVEDTKEDYAYWLQWDIQPNIAAVGTATYGEYGGNFMFLFADSYIQMLLSAESYEAAWNADDVWSGTDRDYDIWSSDGGFW